MTHPEIVSGGMGVYASPWPLPRMVAKSGQLGIVSGTAIHLIVPRLLQLGDQGGHFRRALSAFPDQGMAGRILERYYVSGGISPTARFANIEPFSLNPSPDLIELTICANFCQIWLAKEGHGGKIGVNFLEKVQMPHLYALYGVLLAEVDYLFIGAGIPMQISGVLDKLVQHHSATYNIYVIGTDKEDKYQMHFDPHKYMGCTLSELKRPLFFPIISSFTIARMMTKSGGQKIDGWVVEDYSAGGHSAPPRGKMTLTDDGEPKYGKRDIIDFAELRSIGLPFWCAGGQASPEMLAYAKALGAVGIQAGSIFALSNQSGIRDSLRNPIRKAAYNNELIVFNDPYASPTGFPFKIVLFPETLGDAKVYERRPRICDIGGLLQPYLRDDGSVGYRCPAEPEDSFCLKRGEKEDTNCRICVCNGLFGTVGLAQRLKNGALEPPVVTLGQNLAFLQHIMSDENSEYSAEDVIDYLLS